MFVCAGVTEDPVEVSTRVHNSFGSAVLGLVEQELRINHATTQDVLSCDLIPMYATAGAYFDPRSMVCENLDLKSAEQEVAFCTTDLGLVQSMKNDAGALEETVLMKARVLLVSELQEVLRQ